MTALPATCPASPAAARFPLLLCIASVTMTSLGLSAAALGIKWGAAPPPGDALLSAWLYVHLMLMFTWLVIWPAIALLPRRLERSGYFRARLLTDLAAIAIGAIPATSVAAFISNIPLRATLPMFLLQAALALLAAGALACAHSSQRRALAAVTLLATLALAAPILAFLWHEFFQAASTTWFAFIPALAIHRTATSPSLGHCLPAITYALCGLLLVAFAKNGFRY